MDFLLYNIIPYIITYKYVALFLISLVAAFILPIPAGSILMAVTALVSEGYFNFSLVVIISIIANILGDNMGYWVARLYGERVFSHIGFRRVFESKTFNLIEKRFREHPGFIVIASRFEVISTLSVNFLAGVGKVPYKKYLLYESIGNVAQVLFYASIGYIFGHNWESVNTIMGKIFIISGIILIILSIKYHYKILFYLKKGWGKVDRRQTSDNL